MTQFGEMEKILTQYMGLQELAQIAMEYVDWAESCTRK